MHCWKLYEVCEDNLEAVVHFEMRKDKQNPGF